MLEEEKKNRKSIFEIYCSKDEFADRFKENEEESVDVIIPLLNTNELWEKNLYSFFKEIPINRLLIGDGGCTDGSVKIVKKFPRVKIIDQTSHNSLGYCIKELIENVETGWFVYLHADVYLPEGWYDEMVRYQNKYDWYECNRKIAILVEYWSEEQNKEERAYSGSQMGRTKVFENVVSKIEDDYLNRNEDIIFSELIKAEGFKYGRIPDTYHYHQVMNKRNEKEPSFEKIIIKKARDIKWRKRTYDMQARGIIKYLQPKTYLVKTVNESILKLSEVGELDWSEFNRWVKKTNPVWLKHIKKSTLKETLIKFILKIFRKLV